jgi:hypothetical protein
VFELLIDFIFPAIYAGHMRVNTDRSITISDWLDRLVGPPQRNGCLSAREVRHRAAVATTMALNLPEDQYQAVVNQLPHLYVEGLVALDRRYGSETTRLAGNHPKRIKMLEQAEDLPYLSHWNLLRRATEAATRLTGELDISWHRDTMSAEQKAIRAEAAIMMRLLIVLVLLSSADQHKHPGAVLMALLQAFGALVMTPDSILPPTIARPPRVLRPPGRLVLAEPRVARAPGGGVPLVVHRSEATSGCARFGGTL